MKFGIVVGEFHKALAKEMLASAEAEIKKSKHDVAEVIWVPGSYEAPLAMQHILSRSDVDGAVLLGYIERGETMHGEVMGHVVHAAMVELMFKYGKPIGIGVIGPGATKEQAEKRKASYGAKAAKAAITMVKRLKR